MSELGMLLIYLIAGILIIVIPRYLHDRAQEKEFFRRVDSYRAGKTPYPKTRLVDAPNQKTEISTPGEKKGFPETILLHDERSGQVVYLNRTYSNVYRGSNHRTYTLYSSGLMDNNNNWYNNYTSYS